MSCAHHCQRVIPQDTDKAKSIARCMACGATKVTGGEWEAPVNNALYGKCCYRCEWAAVDCRCPEGPLTVRPANYSYTGLNYPLRYYTGPIMAYGIERAIGFDFGAWCTAQMYRFVAYPPWMSTRDLGK